MDTARKLQPLEGKLVEIHSLAGAPRQGTYICDGDSAEVQDVVLKDGEKGRCVAWTEEDKQYIVETFSGLLVGIPEENLKEYFPPAPEHGGFDVVWPSGAYPSALFGHMVSDHLMEKGYCVVQTFLGERDHEEVYTVADEQPEFHRFKAELEDGYLGFKNNTKVATMEHDAADSDPTNAMERCVRQMTVTGLLLSSLSPTTFGLDLESQTNPMVRLPILESEAIAYAKHELTEDDVEDGYVEVYLRFCAQRSISMLYLVDNEGGTIKFYPPDNSEFAPVSIPITANKMVIFRNDLMQYSYEPKGKSVAVQTWLMSRDAVEGNKQAIMINDEFTYAKMGFQGAGKPTGDPAKVMSFMVRYPIGWGNGEYWAAFTQCTDGCRMHPFLRWDHEVYCEEGEMAVPNGKSYTKHGGFLDDDVLMAFDNNYFGYTEHEARFIAPGPRMLLETGYQALYMAGHKREDVDGKPIGVWVGDVGSDWHSVDNYWPIWTGARGKDIELATYGVNPAMAAFRLSHFLNLSGPLGSFDTACSASLVATATAHEKMQHPNTECPQNICLGWNTLLGPFSFIGNCAGNMLSHTGRSWTFDRSADGYQRGEGCSAYFIDIHDSEELQRSKLMDLVGSAINQDGRSATITAPNGPAQQECIKRSMRLAGLQAANISICECHGTGTALGDPIEAGALRGVMKGSRTFPLLLCSTKSNFGHLEAGAGAAGLTKCMIMIIYATGPPNCHMRALNPHLDISGYPVLFDTEIGDAGFSELDVGVSSFGYGGTNSRCDVFGQAKGGKNVAREVELPRQSYYNRFIAGVALHPFIAGSHLGWSNSIEMLERKGTFLAEVTIGETGCEWFTIRLDDDPDQAIYPIIADGDTDTPMLGPDNGSKGKCFKVVGMPYVTYLVTLELANGKKAVTIAPKGRAAGNGTIKQWTLPKMIAKHGKEFPADVVWRKHLLAPNLEFAAPTEFTYGIVDLVECPLPDAVVEELQRALGVSLLRFRFGGDPGTIEVIGGEAEAQEGSRAAISDVDYLIMGLFASEVQAVKESPWAPDASDDMGIIAQQSLMFFKELSRIVPAKGSPKNLMVLCDAKADLQELHTAGLLGLLRTVRLEIVALRNTIQYIHSDAYSLSKDAKKVVKQLVTELNFPDQSPEVRYEGDNRFVQKTIPSDMVNTRAKAPPDCFDGGCIITGGLGGLGVVTAESLVAAGGRCVVLCSRSGKITRDNQGLGDKLDALTKVGADVVVAKCDTTKEQSVIEILDDTRKNHAPVRSIVHAAGTLDDKYMQTQTVETFRYVWQPKAYGAWLLHKHTAKAKDNIQAFITFSSTACLMGNAAQSNYSASNSYMDGLCRYRRREGLAATSFMWPAVADVGMFAGLDARSTEGVSRDMQYSVPGVRRAMEYCLACGIIACPQIVGWPAMLSVGEQTEWVVGQMALFQHEYFLSGSFNSWEMSQMDPVREDDNTWEITIPAGSGGRFDFRIVRDCDLRQSIYPETSSQSSKDSTPSVIGPDAHAAGRFFSCEVAAAEPIKVSVSLLGAGAVIVRASSSSIGEVVWTSSAFGPRHRMPVE